MLPSRASVRLSRQTKVLKVFLTQFVGHFFIFTAVSRHELSMPEEYIHRIDPNAFLTVIGANEILGKGFKSLGEKIPE
ncbi:MAG: DUF2179 domain-containing protein [Lentimicrobiaceae bacterium]|nr:DUF2179 domain-containing protein [Lentimicrobiaceae bacterium]